MAQNTDTVSPTTSELGKLDEKILNGEVNIKTTYEYTRKREAEFDEANGRITKRRKSFLDDRMEKYTDRHVRRSEKYGRQIRKSYLALQSVQSQYGPRILKLWKSKGPEERAAILRKAKPGIPLQHSPDLHFFRSRFDDDSLGRETARDYFLMPYVNIEDLTKESNLPRFAHSRAYAEPYKFALADHFHLKWAQDKMINGPIKLREKRIWLGRTSKFMTYGETISALDDPSRGEHGCGVTLDSSEGLLVLEAQDKTYRFLVDCCNLILSDGSKQEREAAKKSVSGHQAPWTLPEDVEKEDTDNAYLEPWSSHIPSLRWLRNYLEHMQRDEEERWNRLRSNPAYFIARLRAYYCGKISRNGQTSPAELNDPTSLEVAVKELFCAGLRSVMMWRWLVSIAALLADADEENNAEDINHRVLQMKAWLSEFAEARVKDLLGSGYDMNAPVLKHPRLQPGKQEIASEDVEMFKWLRSILNSSTTAEHKAVEPLRATQDLRWYLYHKGLHKHVSDLFEIVLIDINNITLCLEALCTSPEWHATEIKDIRQDVKEYKLYDSKLATFEAKIHKMPMRNIVRRCLPLHEKFAYPVSGARNKETVEKRRSVEALLNELMLPLENLINNYNLSENFWVDHLRGLLQSYSPKRTPEWVEPSTKIDAIVAKEVELHPVEEVAKTLADAVPEVDDTTTEGIQEEEGERHEEEEQDKDDEDKDKNAEDEEDDPVHLRILGAKSARRQSDRNAPAFTMPSKFKCNKRAYRVFQILFDKSVGQAREMEFDEFKYAMEYIGFKASKLPSGSAWEFVYTPESGVKGQRKITEHRPHDGFYRRVGVRDQASRLRFHFRWHIGTFVLEETKS